MNQLIICVIIFSVFMFLIILALILFFIFSSGSPNDSSDLCSLDRGLPALSKSEKLAKDIKLAPLPEVIFLSPIVSELEPKFEYSEALKEILASEGLEGLEKVESSLASHTQTEIPKAKLETIESADVIPHNVHQIWLGNKNVPVGIEKWKNLCQKYNYQYTLWRENDILNFKLINEKYYLEFLKGKNYQGAADVARYEILARHGGLYVDADIRPLDLPIFDYLPKHGFGIVPEHLPKQISLPVGSVFFGNSFIVSSVGHSILQHVIKSLPLNYEHFRQIDNLDPQLVTGPYLLTSCVHGLYTVIDKSWILVDVGNNEKKFHLVEVHKY